MLSMGILDLLAFESILVPSLLFAHLMNVSERDAFKCASKNSPGSTTSTSGGLDFSNDC